jgi:hypothetical protein
MYVCAWVRLGRRRGHSGAPLFDESGRVTGLHCAWDDRTGMRHGQQLPHLRAALGKATQEVAEKKTAAGRKNTGGGVQKRRKKKR